MSKSFHIKEDTEELFISARKVCVRLSENGKVTDDEVIKKALKVFLNESTE